MSNERSVYEFPVEKAKQRLVPVWQRRGELRRLPNPYLNNNELLLRTVLHDPRKTRELLRSRVGKQRILALVENDTELFAHLAAFRRDLLDRLGRFELYDRLDDLGEMVLDEGEVVMSEDLSEYDDVLSEFNDDEILDGELTEHERSRLEADFRGDFIDDLARRFKAL